MENIKFALEDGVTTVEDIMDKLSVKKSDVSNHKAFENLRSICQSIKQRRDPRLIAELFHARLELLETVAITYADQGEEELFDVSTDEMEMIKTFLVQVEQ